MDRKIHLIAICGTGMASLAGLLKEKGFEVTGSDMNVYPPMSDQLASLKIRVQTGFRPENIDSSQPDLVIVGNAVSKDNAEVQRAQEKGIRMLSMPEAIENLFLADRCPIVVSGTHGKTTASGLLAWLLERSGQSPGFLVGGLLKNFGRSYQLGTGDYFVIEGDEYDSAFFDKGPKFLHYRPQMLILNAVEFDHADIYHNLEALLQAFSQLISLMPPNGLIVADGDNLNVQKLIQKSPGRVVTFGLRKEAEWRADEIQLQETTRFRLFQKNREIGEVTSPLIGRHNVKNLLGVIGILFEIGIPLREINIALSEFQGVKRRQEVLATVREITIVDDFAHHPTAVYETLAALRARYPDGRIWSIFEPRSNTTRRAIFQNEFVHAFDPADEVLIAPPYLPEKIPPEERLDPQRLIEDLKKRGKNARTFSGADPITEMVQILTAEARTRDIFCFMSNGAFGGIHQKVIEALRNR